MNWGKGIAIVLTVFMTFILTLAITMMRTSSDLESEDYYAREVNYEQEIQAQKNAAQGEKISYVVGDEFIVFNVPNSLNSDEVQISLIRPNDKNLDRQYQFQRTNTLLIAKKELVKGRYKLEISYQSQEKECLQKEELFL